MCVQWHNQWGLEVFHITKSKISDHLLAWQKTSKLDAEFCGDGGSKAVNIPRLVHVYNIHSLVALVHINLTHAISGAMTPGP